VIGAPKSPVSSERTEPARAIVPSGEAPASSIDFSGCNSWHGTLNDQVVTIYAGAAGYTRPHEGEVFWLYNKVNGYTVHGGNHRLPNQGPLCIVADRGSFLLLRATESRHLYRMSLTSYALTRA
jgi:hypothetical protein